MSQKKEQREFNLPGVLPGVIAINDSSRLLDVPRGNDRPPPSTVEVIFPFLRRLSGGGVEGTKLQTEEVMAEAQLYDAIAAREMARDRAVHATEAAQLASAETVHAGASLGRKEQLARAQHTTALIQEKVKRTRLKRELRQSGGGKIAAVAASDERIDREYAERIGNEKAKARGERKLRQARMEIYREDVQAIFSRYEKAYSVTMSAFEKILACGNSVDVRDIIPEAPAQLILEVENIVDERRHARE